MLGDALLTILREFGPFIGVLLFFIWRDWKREDRLTARIETMELYQRETLVDLLKKSTVALSNNAECLKWIGRLIDRICGKCSKWEIISEPPQIDE